MGKSIFFWVLICFCHFKMVGQTFHAIIFANTKNDNIGQSVQVDYDRMLLETKTVAKSIGYSLKKYTYYGTAMSFNRDNLDRVIDGLSCGPQDIVFFYYSGHGGRAMNEDTNFPEMCLFVNEVDFVGMHQYYSLHDVYTRLLKKKPRLVIAMGDLCNSTMTWYEKPTKSASQGPSELSKGTCEVYRNLFLDVTGGFIMASSKPKVTSTCLVSGSNPQRHLGGNFTHYFLENLQNSVSHDVDLGWNELLDKVIVCTQRHLVKDDDKCLVPQTPVYKNELTKVEISTPIPPIVISPQPPLPSNDEVTNQQDQIAYLLSKVCNSKLDKMERIRNIMPALEPFSSVHARIQVVGADSRTLVNTTNIQHYLNYLSIATQLLEISVVDLKKDTSGKVNYLKVHEIHYK